MTDSAIIESAINGDNFSATYYPDEDEYIWPWVIRESDDGDYITAANTCVDGSYAIILARFTAQANMILKLVREQDPNAFLTVGSVMGVYGQGFDALNKA
jgi:hypothetical protein